MTSRAGRGAALATAGIAAAGAATLAYGVFVERNRFTVREETLAILPPGSRPLTILHLSDLHMAPWQDLKQAWVAELSTVEPDLVVNTGDNLGHPDGLAGLRLALDPFRGVPGVYVHGSNDVWGPVMRNPLRYFSGPSRLTTRGEGEGPRGSERLDTAALDRYFKDDLGWLSLNNAAHAIETRGIRLELFGTDDPHRDWDDIDAMRAGVASMRESLPAADARIALGVTHAPYRRILDALVETGADLLLAGHTHGGQVRIPGRPALVTNCDIPPAQASGLSAWPSNDSNVPLNVSAGLGTSIYAPIRFACPPEAVVLTLTAK